MRQNLKNSSNGVNRLLGQLAAEKKKVVVASCLIGVMVFMWARVLGGKTPESAEAAVMAQAVNLNDKSKAELKISFIELPKVKGRNDVLIRDFFAVGSWQDFMRGGEGESLAGIEEVGVVSRDGSEEVVKRVAEKLKLEAIGLSENPQAFINDKLLSVGDKLLVRDGTDMYECEVVRIEEKTVFIRCGEAEITLKLKQMIKVINY